MFHGNIFCWFRSASTKGTATNIFEGFRLRSNQKTAVVASSRRVVLATYRQSARAPPDQQNLPWRLDPGKCSSQQEMQRPDDEDVQHGNLSSLTYIIIHLYTYRELEYNCTLGGIAACCMATYGNRSDMELEHAAANWF